ncbi:MAG TPA: regulatory iron-sulfur-containing complex subunit RicT [Thermoanaerobaculaceae bacterium]|nr:regulatory iron-sulfur-containing complex subunit RicT [Thermoanaerobaculaceae bacterium]
MSCSACSGGIQPQHGFARITFSPDLPGQVCALKEGVELEPGAHYVVASSDGERVGRLLGRETPVLKPCNGRVAGSVVRRATPAEVTRSEELASVARDALRFCRERARELNLALRPVTAVVPLDRDSVVISFAAEERVDFRELLRDLGRRTRRRVELRQIGVRDQAKASGGWGPCGRTLCCATFMARFNSVTIRMAKAQRLSLNPSRISGMCGRLMCCLAHEAGEPATPKSVEAAH